MRLFELLKEHLCQDKRCTDVQISQIVEVLGVLGCKITREDYSRAVDQNVQAPKLLNKRQFDID